MIYDRPPQTNSYNFQSVMNDKHHLFQSIFTPLVKLQSMMRDIISTRTYFFKQTCSFFVVKNPIELPGKIISTRNKISLIVLKNGIKISKLRTNSNIANHLDGEIPFLKIK